MSGAAARPPGAERLRGLHVLADDAPRWKWTPTELAEAACAGGAHVVQLRAKTATDREALAWAREIRRLTTRAGALFLVNDRFDLALACGADGVHLGQEDLPPHRVRAAGGDGLLLGRSTHTREQWLAACREPVDYLAFGPVFATRSKASEHAPRGTAQLAEAVAAAAPRPVVAIGGIDLARMPAIGATGAGAAVIAAVAAADDPQAAARALVLALGRPPVR